jgi:hypothetical protein
LTKGKNKNDVSRLRLILPPNIMKTVLNLMRRRFVGGTALLIGVGMFIGWLFTIGSGVLTFLQK